MARLGCLAGSVRPHVQHGRSEAFQQWQRALEKVCRSPTHYGERTPLSAFGTTRHRRIDQSDTVGRESPGKLARGRRINRAHVNDQ